ncbi:ROK family transcriptional regulator [Devosia sp. YIM 151766]|uniref:ROK family transcriptional regulator n=1 Tax=Devosia sp. YIM 151766 TaxID=3017325 RepID=UPI00255C8148|nr:ROK family transcriptional regulator [Devosia sp. YIM 151766]WIY52019.1 ROK family transcriptional regulator [Devosia sp. YIM 151766]
MIRDSRGVAGSHSSVLRRANSIEIFHAIRLQPGISQREIGDRTGIDKSTISAVINQFDSLRLLERVADETRKGRGRPSESFKLNGAAGMMLGIDIEPERLVVISAGIDGHLLHTSEYPAVVHENEFADSVAAAVSTHLDQSGKSLAEVRSIGVCLPGLVDRSGKLISSSNFRWGTVDVAGELSQRLGQRVWVDNDARGAGLAERLFGCCVDVDDYVFIDSHSGVGGALYLEGAIYAGSLGIAGEIGHTKIVPFGRTCQCGDGGCLSAYISGPALRQSFKGTGLVANSFPEMKALADQGIPEALGVLDEAGQILGLALSNFINLLNPPNIVIGGGLAVLAPHLMPPAERILRRHALPEALAHCTILISKLSQKPHSHGPLAVALQGLSYLNADGPFPW